MSKRKKIAFQGERGANSHIACNEAYRRYEPLPCPTFEDAFAAVRTGRAALAMIPIDNSVAGRVADIHHLLPDSGLHIIGEHFQPVVHHLLAIKGATIAGLKTVHSHIHALPQCRRIIAELGLKPIVHADTAGAAADVAARQDPSEAAIASALAGEIYGLASLRANIEDARHNTTRFLVMSREPRQAKRGSGLVVTSFVFRVRNVPAALYKALGGFATNGVNMTKLESYMLGGRFTATQFYADVEAHPDDRPLKLALEELRFFSREVRVLGVYTGHAFRRSMTQGEAD
jgi:prephenate dehydratase